MQAALKVAKAVMANEDATQEEIDAALAALDAAIKALTPATGKNPETSDSNAVEAYVITMLVSLLAALVLTAGRKRFMQ